ncbi:MAG: hypothetical protein GWO82_05820, partial [Bacteroidetes bacterium]|nr:hypothetical protein [Bacteroidota bacterium]
MATIYIENFDQSQNVDTLGRVEYRTDFQAPTTDVTLNVNVPTERLREAFQYLSWYNDTEEESAYVKWTNRNDRTDDKEIIPYDTNSASTISSSYGKYRESSSPGAALDFLQQLAKAVFGSTSGVDLFSNEDDVADAYKEAIIYCGSKIESIPSDSIYLYNDQITDDEAAVAGVFVDNIVHDNTSEALTSKAYTFSQDGGTVVGSGSGSGTDLILEVTVDIAATPKFTNVKVLKPGSGYASGEVLTMTDGATSATKIVVTLSDASLYYVNGNMKHRATIVNTGRTNLATNTTNFNLVNDTDSKIADGTYIVKETTTQTEFDVVIESGALTHLVVKTKGTSEFEASGSYSIPSTQFGTTIDSSNVISITGLNSADVLAILNQTASQPVIPDGTYIVTEPTTKTVFEVVIELGAVAYLLLKTKGTTAFSSSGPTSGAYELVGTLFVNENTTIVPDADNKITLDHANFTTDDLHILNQTNNVGKHSIGGKAAQDVLSGLLNQTKERFELASICTYTPTNSTFDGVYKNVSASNSNSTNAGSGATFDVMISNGNVTSLRVNTRGKQYLKTDVLTIASSDVGGKGAIAINLDDTFVNMINGPFVGTTFSYDNTNPMFFVDDLYNPDATNNRDITDKDITVNLARSTIANSTLASSHSDYFDLNTA